MTPQDKRRILIDYLRMKADECDWHGVRDACVDLETLEAASPECVSPLPAVTGPDVGSITWMRNEARI